MRKHFKIIGTLAFACACWPAAVIAASAPPATTSPPAVVLAAATTTTVATTTTAPTTTQATTTTVPKTTVPATTAPPAVGKAVFQFLGPPGYTDYYTLKGVSWKVVDAAGSDITARCVASEAGKGILSPGYTVTCPLPAGVNKLTVTRTSDMPAEFLMPWGCRYENVTPSAGQIGDPAAPNTFFVPAGADAFCHVGFGPAGVYFVQKYSDAQTGGKPVNAALMYNGAKVPCVNDPRWPTSPSGGPNATSVSWCAPPVTTPNGVWTAYRMTPEVVPPVAGYHPVSYWTAGVPAIMGKVNLDATSALTQSGNYVPPVGVDTQVPWALLVTNLVADTPAATTTTTTTPTTTTTVPKGGTGTLPDTL